MYAEKEQGIKGKRNKFHPLPGAQIPHTLPPSGDRLLPNGSKGFPFAKVNKPIFYLSFFLP